MKETEVAFIQYHSPALKSGTYKIAQQIDLPDYAFNKALTQYISVGTERFVLPSTQVFAVFPPKNNQGDYKLVLPHIELHRSTLPWERRLCLSQSPEAIYPWLALVLLDESEEGDPQKVRRESITGVAYRDAVSLPPEAGEDVKAQETTSKTSEENANPAQQPVEVLYLEKQFALNLLPTLTDLAALSHVRKGVNDVQEAFERAIVVANRLPKAGSQTAVHLISLEGRFQEQNGQYVLDTEKGQKAYDGTGFMPFLSLYSWRFRCPSMPNDPKMPNRNLKNLLLQLDKNPFRLPMPQQHPPPEAFKPLLESGSLPLVHKLRNGGKTISWYRGAFMPIDGFEHDLHFTKSADSPDEFLLFHPETRMLEVSYAAAWELGRLLMLGNPVMSHKLKEWKLAQIQKETYHKQRRTSQYIPTEAVHFASDDQSPLSLTLKRHFEELALLLGIPFHYLIPDEALLPPESVRVFQLNRTWIKAMLQGAYSMSYKVARPCPWKPSYSKALYGVLLRSEAVAGWPALLVEALRKKNGESEAKTKVKIIRKAHLASDVLLYLFEEKFSTIKIHLPVESLHFGFAPANEAVSQLHKSLKDPKTGKLYHPEKTLKPTFTHEALRIMNIAKLLEDAKGLGESDATFPIQLLEGETRLVLEYIN